MPDSPQVPVHAVVQTPRLDLMITTPDLYVASLADDQAAVEALIQATVPTDWFADRDLLTIFQRKLNDDPGYQPWALRHVVLRSTQQAIGHIGFHTAPDPAYLKSVAPGGIELGYTIYPDYRKQGYAREATEGLIDWAWRTHGLTRFVLSISPTNIPSTRIALGLGFMQVGEYMDEEDGLELVYRLDRPAPPEK